MAALKSDGSVWTWGEGGGGRLGNNASTNRSSPVSVVGGHSFVEVSAVANHYAALKADGTIWAWGNNGSGQLGQNSVASRSSPISVVGDHSFTGVMAAVSSTFAVKADGSVWAWGANGDGRLGDGTITNRSSPVQILGSTLALPRSINQIVADDRLVWNGARAGFDLDASDLIDLVYVV
jgi:alpha-tubulin suppressor-like RCC1 family protein